MAKDQSELFEARTVNRQLRLERLAEKERERLARAGAGSLAGLMRAACTGKHANDPQAQLAFMLARADVMAALGAKRRVSEKTLDTYGDTLARSIEELRMMQAPIRNIDELDRAHAIALTRYWLEQGHAAISVQAKVSVLRRFLTLVGKVAAMPKGQAWLALLEENGINTDSLRSPAIPTQHKAWQPNGVNPLEIMPALRKRNRSSRPRWNCSLLLE